MTEVAIYARVSTERQEREGTIDSQLDALHRLAAEHGWQVPPERVYVDDGWSGSRLDRPALDALRDVAADGGIGTLLVYSPDRLARNFVYQQVLLEELQGRGAKIIFHERPITENPEDRLLVQMQGVFAEYERAKIAERMRRGKLHKARTQGWLNWNIPPFGYRVIHEEGVHKVALNEEEAGWVRQAYRWVLDEGLSARQVAIRLNSLGVRPRLGRIWVCCSAYNLFKNTAYSGTAYYNKTQASEPKRHRRPGAYLKHAKSGHTPRPKEQWIPVAVPAIVTPEEQSLVREQLSRNKLISTRNTRNDYLLRTLVVCGKCGWHMHAVSQDSKDGRTEYFYYACMRRRPEDTGRDEPCRTRYVRSDRLDAVVWDSLREWLREPEVVRAELEALPAATHESRDLLEREIERLNASVQAWGRQSQRLLDAYQAGAIELSDLEARMEDLKRRIESARTRSAELRKQRARGFKGDEVFKSLEALTQTLRDGMDAMTFAERQRLVRLLVERVVVNGEDVTIEHVVPLKGRFSDLRLGYRVWVP
jgi:site-specific DNA recombinase